MFKFSSWLCENTFRVSIFNGTLNVFPILPTHIPTILSPQQLSQQDEFLPKPSTVSIIQQKQRISHPKPVVMRVGKGEGTRTMNFKKYSFFFLFLLPLSLFSQFLESRKQLAFFFFFSFFLLELFPFSFTYLSLFIIAFLLISPLSIFSGQKRERSE